MFDLLERKDAGDQLEIPSLTGVPLDLEQKFTSKTGEIEGHASFFDQTDQGGDVVLKGAYRNSLRNIAKDGRKVKMLWQHDPGAPIGVWDEVKEDSKGLYVKGRILPSIEKGRETIELIEAGAIDGMSIGYRTIKANTDAQGLRQLMEVDLWEVSMVTFPMLPSARVESLKEQPTDPDPAKWLDIRAVEAHLRDELGLSWSECKKAVAEIKSRAARDGSEDENAAFLRQFREIRGTINI